MTLRHTHNERQPGTPDRVEQTIEHNTHQECTKVRPTPIKLAPGPRHLSQAHVRTSSYYSLVWRTGIHHQSCNHTMQHGL